MQYITGNIYNSIHRKGGNYYSIYRTGDIHYAIYITWYYSLCNI